MTNEEFQRHVDFILQQQARFAAGIEILQEESREAKKQSDERIRQIEAIIVRLANATAAGFSGFDDRMKTLAEAQQRTDEKLAETDERLSSLIGVFERYISEKRNGKSES